MNVAEDRNALQGGMLKVFFELFQGDEGAGYTKLPVLPTATFADPDSPIELCS